MLLNNITPGASPTLSQMQVGDVFVLSKFPDKILILTELPSPQAEHFGLVELGPAGVFAYKAPIMVGGITPEDTVIPIKIESVNFKQL